MLINTGSVLIFLDMIIDSLRSSLSRLSLIETVILMQAWEEKKKPILTNQYPLRTDINGKTFLFSYEKSPISLREAFFYFPFYLLGLLFMTSYLDNELE